MNLVTGEQAASVDIPAGKGVQAGDRNAQVNVFSGDQVRLEATAGRDAYVAGRDLNVNVGGAGPEELGLPGLLPRDVPGFTGRGEELARLASLAGGGRVVVSAIGGTAGIGKTALAVHAAHQLLPQFPDGHLYADLRGYTEGQDPAGSGEVLEVFLRRCGVPAGEVPAGVEERSGLLRQVLAGRRVLMLLDNARTEAQVRPLLPGAGGSLVLVTSRSVLPGLEADERISLDILPTDEAATMLAQVIGTARAAAEPHAVTEMALLCGRLPLALRIAGQLLAVHPAWPVTRLARMLAGERDRLTRLGAGDLQVRAAFGVSYGQLAGEDARLFRFLGLHPGPDFSAASAAFLAGTEPPNAAAALGRLAEAHLVTEGATGRFGMHDLLRLFARQTCQTTDDRATRDSAQTQLVDYYGELAWFLGLCINPEGRSSAAEIAASVGGSPLTLRQALAAFEAERPSMLAAVGLVAELQARNERTGLLVKLRYLDDLFAVQEAALEIAHPLRETALSEVGSAAQEREPQWFREAVGCYQDELAIYRENGYRNGEGLMLNNLGNAYYGVRRFEEAIRYYKDAVALYRLGDYRHGRIPLNKLGNAYYMLRRFEEAMGCYQDAVAIFREIGDGYGESQALANLGVVYRNLGQADRAAVCWQEAAAAMRDAGDQEQAERLEQLNPGTQTEPEDRFGVPRRSSS